MKKKFLSAFLLGALTLAATSTMTSCKDYDDDISGLKKEIASLEDLVKTKEQTINSSIANLEAAINKANGEHATKAALEEAKKALQAAIDKNYSTLVEKDAELSAAIVKAQTAADAASALATENKAAIEKVAADLATANEKLGTLSDKLEKAIAETAELKTALAAQKTALEAAEQAITDGDKATLDAAKAAVADLQKEVAAADAALAQKIAEEGAAVAKEFDAVKGTIDELQVAHNNLAAEVGTLSTKVNGLETKISNVTTLVNKVDAKYDVLTKVLAKALRSLVFEPNLYVDGIESIEYPFVFQWGKAAQAPEEMTRTRDGITDNLSEIVDYNWPAVPNFQAYGPVWGVNYHMNPSRANIEFADVRGFLDREVEVVSRADEGLNIVAAEKDAAGTTVFACKNGVVTTGIQVKNAANLYGEGDIEAYYTEYLGQESQFGDHVHNILKWSKDHVVALQVNSANGTAQDTLITSDYAMLYPREVYPAWLKWNPGNLENSGEYLYDNPKDALTYHAPVEIVWNDEKGVNLEAYIRTVASQQLAKPNNYYTHTWTNADQKKWGLHYEFETVEYKSASNQTIDSRYCKLDKYTGNIVARNVGNDGKTLESQNIASVGREPLVRVLLMLNDTPILDGYILVKIVEKPADVPAKEDKNIDDYTTLDWKVDFNGCNSYETPKTTWAQFNEWVLTNALEITKENFDRQYVIDGSYVGSVLATGTNETSTYLCEVYSEPNEDAPAFDASVYYIKDANNINNCTFRAEMTASEIEKYTHGNLDPTNLVFYVRFKEVPGTDAKYANIWVKFDIDVTRSQITGTISEKNSNYWFALDGADEGWDAVAFNIGFPQDGIVPTTWTNQTLNTFIQNKVVVSDENVTAKKFFFLPINTTITDQHGTTWTITTQNGPLDGKWNQLICKYNAADTHTWPTIMGLDGEAQTDATKIAEILRSCAINYNNGAFTRNTLYATKGDGVYTAIAGMNQATGEIELIRSAANYNEPLDLIVNALGYEENHANINTEFHAITGIVGRNSCGVAVDLYSVSAEAGDTKSHAIWTSSWQRPINFNNLEARVVEDANANGEYIDILSLLSFYDWRGPVAGSMEGNNKWLWGYYNINGIIIDTNPEVVTTDMAGGTLGKTTLAEKSRLVHLYPATAKRADAVLGAGQARFNFDLTPWNKASLNGAFKTWLNINEAKFGYIYYENNGSNVEDFTVRIPVEIIYEWGHFTTTVDVLIKRTQGN